MHPNSAKTAQIDRRKHILVVDDDHDVLDVITEMLRQHGDRVSAAVGGESMRAALDASDSVDAVVLDALMPGESSHDLALYAKRLQLPVVMISGSPDSMQFAIEHCLQLLEKPFQMQQLFDALEQAIGSGVFGQRDL
jgi:two-component system, OmpR family, lantibiotic biosynthesis response regulator NisR/SpaR